MSRLLPSSKAVPGDRLDDPELAIAVHAIAKHHEPLADIATLLGAIADPDCDVAVVVGLRREDHRAADRRLVDGTGEEI